MQDLSYLKRSIYSGLTFFMTVLILSVGYATIGNTWTTPSALEVGAGSGLTASAWNSLLANFNTLDARTAPISSLGGNVGIGATSPEAKLEINGDLIRSMFYYEPGVVTNVTFPANTWSPLGNGWNFTYTKKSATSKLLITINAVARWNYTASSGGWGYLGFNINGTNYDFWWNYIASTDMHTPGMYRRAISGIPKGAVTFQGVVNQTSTNWVCIGCTGVPNITIEEIY